MKDSPQVVQALKEGMLVGTADAVQFQNAPIYMKEALTFPYRYGIDFIAEMLIKGGKEKAFAELFQNPPRTTRQIMEPKTYLAGERIWNRCLCLTFGRSSRSYDRFDVGAIGEFDVAVLIDQYAGADIHTGCIPTGGAATTMLPGPRAMRPRRWRCFTCRAGQLAEKASDFAAIYANAMANAISHVHDVAENGKDASAGSAALEKLSGKRTWLTEDGPVVIEARATP